LAISRAKEVITMRASGASALASLVFALVTLVKRRKLNL
jgi:hypothetical protein